MLLCATAVCFAEYIHTVLNCRANRYRCAPCDRRSSQPLHLCPANNRGSSSGGTCPTSFRHAQGSRAGRLELCLQPHSRQLARQAAASANADQVPAESRRCSACRRNMWWCGADQDGCLDHRMYVQTCVMTWQVQPAATIAAATRQQMAAEAAKHIRRAASSACSGCARMQSPPFTAHRTVQRTPQAVFAALVRTWFERKCRP